ncbi:MAG: hypothetical protein RRZ92_02580 [Bacilli bacterium]
MKKMDNIKQKRIYEIFAYLLVYRVQNDIDEANKQINGINDKIKEKQGSKINANFLRNGSIKDLTAEVEYKTSYRDMLNGNAFSNNLEISDITVFNLPDIIKSTFEDDEDFAQRYALLTQLIYHPMYYNFVKKNYDHEEKCYEFSLSNISKFLGFDSAAYEKIENDSKIVAKTISFGLSKGILSSLKLSVDILRIVDPLAIPLFNVSDVVETSFITSESEYNGIFPMGVSSLLSTQELSEAGINVYMNVLASNFVKLSDDDINGLGYSVLLLIRYYKNKCGDTGILVAKNLALQFLNWKHDYEVSILLQVEKDTTTQIVRNKFDTLNIISKEIISLSLA